MEHGASIFFVSKKNMVVLTTIFAFLPHRHLNITSISWTTTTTATANKLLHYPYYLFSYSRLSANLLYPQIDNGLVKMWLITSLIVETQLGFITNYKYNWIYSINYAIG